MKEVVPMQKPLYIYIYNDLKDKISSGFYKIGQMIPTEKELTITYGVSRITVQKAVNLLADDGIVDRKSGVGTLVVDATNRKLPKKFLGLILPGITDSYGKVLLQSIITEAEKRNYQLIVKFSKESQSTESKLVDELINMPVDGLLIEPVQHNFYDSNLIKRIYDNFPIVILDKELNGIDSLLVSSDHYEGALESAGFLIEHGQQNIALIGYEKVVNSTLEKRIDAFTNSFWETSIPLVSDHIARIIKSTYLSKDLSLLRIDIDAIKEFIKNVKATCIVSLDTYIIGLVQQAVSELGLVIPNDVSLFGFDSNNSSFLSSNYTHLAQNEEAIGQKAVELLTKTIQKEKVTSRRWLIPTTIIDCGTIKTLPN